MRKVSLVIICLLLVMGAFAQNRNFTFSKDSIKFFQEMDAFLKEARPKEAKFFMKEFEISWYGGKFNEQQRQGVYDMCNDMLGKRQIKPFPDFKNYLYAVQSFVESDKQSDESFLAWQESVRKLLDFRKSKKFRDYIEMSFNLFEYNLIYKSPSTEWESSNLNFKFDFDSLPKLVFESLDLLCYSKGDSAVIYDTKGVYYPTEETWYGKKGKVYWDRAGFSRDSVYAELKSYTVKLRTPSYSADSVTFYNKLYLEKPLEGILSEKVLANVKPQSASYPRFDSYNKRIVIKNITENVDYDGGFSMYGAKFIGAGSEDDDAYVIFYREQAPFLIVSAKRFAIRKDRISSSQAKIKFKMDKDSLIHPGLSFKFFFDSREVTFIRDYKGLSKSSYFDSFHQMDMDYEVLKWNIDETTIHLGNLVGGTKKDAYFESTSLFQLDRFEALQARSMTHPFYQIMQLKEKLDTNVVTEGQLAGHMGLSREQIRSLLMTLNIYGYILYDFDNQKFIIRDKLEHYYYSRSGKVDYDAIVIHSEVQGDDNATINLLNYDLKVNGVRAVLLSDSQQVFIIPKGGEIVVKKNRDMIFSGVVRAGKFDFFGNEFAFNYDQFKIDLPNVDSLKLRADGENVNEYGQTEQIPVKSVIEDINGELLIDDGLNKSGVKPFPEYPIFKSKKKSYVYYDKSSIYGGVYKRNDFYFQVDPFTIDSLDNFTNEGINFAGTFSSAGIFPDIQENLRLQEDYSLGFTRDAPPDGYASYSGKGQHYNKIKLSNKGLKGEGKFEYITSSGTSNDITYFPDSMVCVAQTYDIEEKSTAVEFPPTSAENVLVRWHTFRDLMLVKQLEKPFKMYDGSEHYGTLTLRPQGLTGAGKFKFDKAELFADRFKFKFNEFRSDTADFNLLDEVGGNALSFKTNNVNAYITFEGRYGEFKSNGGGSFIEFPQNQYICFMEEFKWFMDNDDIEMTAKKDGGKVDDLTGVKLDGSKFISVHEKQDSLSFYVPKATYDLKKKIIDCKGVKFVNVADAMIYPDSGHMIIQKAAHIETLRNAEIVANYVTQNHKIYNGTINIHGKKDYSGTGYVDYTDENDKVQPIFLENIGVDTTLQTYASGIIDDSSKFMLSPQYEYNGRVFLTSNKADLTFKGNCRIIHDCNTLPRNFFMIHAEIDPQNIYIPIDSNLTNEYDEELLASVLLGNDSLGVYSAWLNSKNRSMDQEILRAVGYLYYHKESGEYRISSKNKIMDPRTFQGNYLSLNTKSCKITGEGQINFGAETGSFKIKSAGSLVHNQVDDDAIFDLMMVLDFFFDESSLDKMAKEFSGSASLDPISLEGNAFEMGLRELLGQAEADKLITQINLHGGYKKVPVELNKALVFNEIRFKWNDNASAYRSYGRIGVGNIFKTQVNRYVNGKVEIQKKRSGDKVRIYLEMDANNWYYFEYLRGVMYVSSSNDEFNTALSELKSDKRKYKHTKGEKPFQFMYYSSDKKKRDFLRDFEID